MLSPLGASMVVRPPDFRRTGLGWALGHTGYRVALTVERNRMSASRPSHKGWPTVLFLRAAAAVGTVVDIVLNLWGPGRVHGSASPPRRGSR